MNAYMILFIAIIGEVFGTTMLKLSDGFKKKLPLMGMIFGMGIAFIGLSLSLKEIPLGKAYAIWSGVGTGFTSAIGILVWKEKISLTKLMGLVLVVLGVIVIRLTDNN